MQHLATNLGVVTDGEMVCEKGKKGAKRTYQSMFLIIFATGRELLSQKAKDSQPYSDMKTSSGILIIRTRAMERSSITTTRLSPPVTNLTRGKGNDRTV
jgi:hypothetical protein